MAEHEERGDETALTMTADEFLNWCMTTTWAEWINGEVVFISVDPRECQSVRTFLQVLLHIFAEEHDLGIVIGLPLRLGRNASIRMPDLCFLSNEHSDRLRENHLEGPADLVIEIVTSESGPRDRGEKFYEYQDAGVYEYWLIYPERQQAEFHRLDEAGHYRWILPDSTGVVCSEAVSGFRLKADWLWQDPLPRLVQVLRELQLL